MGVHPIVRPAGLAAVILSIIQSIAWLVLSILSIVMHTGSYVPNIKPDNSTNKFGELIYNLYINDVEMEKDTTDERFITNKIFFYISITYCVLSAIWLIISLVTSYYLMHTKWKPIKILFILWISITSIISVMDLSVVGLIAADYSMKFNQNTEGKDNDALVAIGIVMSIVARGYLFIVINIVFIGFLLKFVCIFKEIENEPLYNDVHINAFQPTADLNWFIEARNDDKTGPKVSHVNGGFIADPLYNDPNSMQGNDYDERPYNNMARDRTRELNRELESPNRNSQFAGLRRTNNHSPQLNKVNPPIVPPMTTQRHIEPDVFIPEPDYTPPNSPNFPRSVLKSKYRYG